MEVIWVPVVYVISTPLQALGTANILLNWACPQFLPTFGKVAEDWGK